MELIVLLVLAGVIGYWFARSNASQSLANTAKSVGNRLRRKPTVESTKTAEGRVE